MSGFWQVLSAVLPVFCLAGTGFWLRRVSWLTSEADHSLMRVVVNVLTPCLIADRVLDNPALRRVDNLLVPPLFGFGGICLGLGVSWLFRRWSGLAAGRSQRTFVCGTGHQNYGYAALPLVILLFPRETAGVLFVHNLGVDVAMWSLGLVALGHAGFHEWRKLLNPPILSVFGALALNALHGERWLPPFVLTTLHMLGECCFPLGILLIGATMADTAGDLHGPGAFRVMTASVAIRCLVLPALLLGLAWVAPVSAELRRVLVVQAAMPAAAFPVVLAQHYGGHPVTAVRVLIATSLAGFITIPLWMNLGLRVLRLAGVD